MAEGYERPRAIGNEFQSTRVSSDFISMYFVNLEKDTFEIFQFDKLRDDVKKVAQEAMSFHDGIEHYIKTFPEDAYKDLLRVICTKEYILEHLENRPDFSIEYMVKDNPQGQKHFEMHFIRSDATQNNGKILLGWKCVDKKYRDLDDVLRFTNTIYREIIDMQTSGVIAIDADTNEILVVNRTALRFMELEKENVIGKKFNDVLLESFLNGELMLDNFLNRMENPSDDVSYEGLPILRSGVKRNVLTQSKRITLSSGQKIVLNTWVDISRMKKVENELIELSELDGLTKINNRMSGERQISTLLEGKEGSGLFVLFDVDKFKHINDTLGHAAGDHVLQRIASAMKKTFREEDVIMRLGGDEYAAFVPDCIEESCCRDILERLIREIERIEVEGLDGKIQVSIGAVIVTGEEEHTFDDVYHCADALMYQCKRDSGNVYRIQQASQTRGEE